MLLSLLATISIAMQSAPAEDSPACCQPASPAALRLAAFAPTQAAGSASSSTDGMVYVPAGTFSMGSTDPLARLDEAPVHRVRVDGFWIDATEVTNAQFQAFVDATGYITVAERPVDWDELRKQLPEGTPRPPDEALEPGSLVFTPPKSAVDLRNFGLWWTWTKGASWKHPEGPGSGIEHRLDHPVVHIAWDDAVAYANWAGKRLPTEAEWERAARGGLDGAVNAWGDEPVDPTRANIWDGQFPHDNTGADGFVRTAPVKSFPPNGYGLYDVAGNVWEWTSDLYRHDEYVRRVSAALRAGEADFIFENLVFENPRGPERADDPRNPLATRSYVHRGGSFLCNDSYCASYRPSARMAAPSDTAMSHLGFRCASDAPPPAEAEAGGS